MGLMVEKNVCTSDIYIPRIIIELFPILLNSNVALTRLTV
jgi:hypothetical protein